MLTRREAFRKAGLAGSLVTIPTIAGSIVANRAEAAVCAALDPAPAVITNFQIVHAAWSNLSDEMTDDEMTEACREECRATIGMLTCPPTTLTGLLFLVETIVSVQAEDDGALGGLSDWTPSVPLGLDLPNAEEMFLATLLTSLRQLAQGVR